MFSAQHYIRCKPGETDCSEKSSILANGSCRSISFKIIPVFRAISALPYLNQNHHHRSGNGDRGNKRYTDSPLQRVEDDVWTVRDIFDSRRSSTDLSPQKGIVDIADVFSSLRRQDQLVKRSLQGQAVYCVKLEKEMAHFEFKLRHMHYRDTQ